MKIQIRRILCPVDFSANSEHALQYAVAFAQTHEAELILLHVMDYAAIDVLDYPSAFEFSTQINEKLREISEERLEQLTAAKKGEYAKVSSRLSTGTPFLEIVNLARKEEIDLIVMGTQGRTGLAHVFMGSVAEKVVRKSACPVLTVKHPEHEFVKP
jgi:nucleotide-binding universal stress UspA family protein